MSTREEWVFVAIIILGLCKFHPVDTSFSHHLTNTCFDYLQLFATISNFQSSIFHARLKHCLDYT